MVLKNFPIIAMRAYFPLCYLESDEQHLNSSISDDVGLIAHDVR